MNAFLTKFYYDIINNYLYILNNKKSNFLKCKFGLKVFII